MTRGGRAVPRLVAAPSRPGPLRIGLSGAGQMGAHHARVLASGAIPGCSLAGIFDPDAARATALAAHVGVPVLGSFHELLSRADAVVVAGPTTVHPEQLRACVAAGRHVLVEKPAAPDLEAAVSLRDAVAATDGSLVVQVGHIEHFNPSVARIRELLHGEPPLVVSARRLGPPTVRTDRLDVVSDLMLHDIHVALSLEPGGLQGVAGVGLRRHGGPTDYAHAALLFDGGLVAQLTASRITQERIRVLEVTTASAHLTADYARQSVEVAFWGDERGRVVDQVAVAAEEPLVAELRAFAEAIRAGSPPEVGLDAAVRCMQVVDAINAALDVRDGRFDGQLPPAAAAAGA
jgi:predicted dehydrogenase